MLILVFLLWTGFAFSNKFQSYNSVAVKLGFYKEMDRLRARAYNHLDDLEEIIREEIHNYNLEESNNRLVFIKNKFEKAADIIDSIFLQMNEKLISQGYELDREFSPTYLKESLIKDLRSCTTKKINHFIKRFPTVDDLLSIL